jgi:hypothetical protein
MLAHHTGQPYDRIANDTERDFFMSAVEAKEYGLIDQVISRPELPDPDRSRYFPVNKLCLNTTPTSSVHFAANPRNKCEN